MNFKNKTIIITGAGSGIGREVALKLLNKDCKIIGVDLKEESLNQTKELAGNLGANFWGYKLDISNKEGVYNFAQEVVQKYGQIDGLLNNAGIIQPFVKTNDLGYEKINQVMDVNFYGSLYMTKAFLPNLLKSEDAFIGNVSSMAGFLPVPGQGIYGASKAALKLMTEALYAELKNTNVSVSIIFPGAVATNITKNSGVKIDMPKQEGKKQKEYKSLPAEKAADIIIKGIAKEKFRIIVGPDSKFMDILYRINPKRAVNMITKQMKDLLK